MYFTDAQVAVKADVSVYAALLTQITVALEVILTADLTIAVTLSALVTAVVNLLVVRVVFFGNLADF